MSSFTRRNFLKCTAAAGLMGAPFSLPAATSGAGALGRTGRPRLRLSLAAYSFIRQFPLMLGKPNRRFVPGGRSIDMFQFVDMCAEQGCEGAELTSYFFAERTDEYLLRLRRHCFLRGVTVSGTAIENNFSHPRGPKRDAELDAAKKWIDRAVLLGAPHIRVFAGVTTEIPRDEADKLVISALEECGDYAGQRGIFLGLENHDSIGTADALLPMVKAVKSPWVGINLDSGNFRTADPYQDFAACVPHAVNVQLKTEIGDRVNGKRDADVKRFIQLLRDGGYQGWVALEYEAKDDPAVAVPRWLKELKTLCA